MVTDLKAQYLRIPPAHSAGGHRPGFEVKGKGGTSLPPSSHPCPDISFLEEAAPWRQHGMQRAFGGEAGGLQKRPREWEETAGHQG